MTSTNEPILGDDARWKRSVEIDIAAIKRQLEIISAQIKMLQQRVK